MCIIINKPENITLRPEVYRNCIEEHEDGVGFAYVENDSIVVKKGLWALERLMLEIKDIEHANHILFHFRTASPQMDVTEDNCHPFTFESRKDFLEDTTPRYHWAVVHNGRLPWRSTKEKSDTRCIVEDALQWYCSDNPDWMTFQYPCVMIHRLINHGHQDTNKMVFMRYDRLLKKMDTHIVNEIAGNVDNGVWFSNTSWKWPKIAPQTPRFPAMGNEYGHGYGSDYDHIPARTSQYLTYAVVGKEPAPYVAPKYTPIDPITPAKKEDKGVVPSPMAQWLMMRFPGWIAPDASGWFWNFSEHIWQHKDTHHKKSHLSYRTPPYDPNHFNAINRLKVIARQKDPEIVVVPEGGMPNPVIPVQTKIGGLDNIQVPRDKNVIKDKRKNRQKTPPLDHLDKRDISMLCGEARSMLICLGHKKAELGTLNAGELIDLLRDQMRYSFDVCRDMTNEEIDQATLQAIRADTLDRTTLYNDSLPGAITKYLN